MTKSTASIMLQINKRLSAVILSFCLIAAIFDFAVWRIDAIQLLLLYSAVTLVFCSVPYIPIPMLQILIQLIGDLLHLHRFPAFLQKHFFAASCMIALGTLLLWLPMLLSLLNSFNNSSVIGSFLFLLCWTLFFRALDYAEQQEPVSIHTLQEQQQHQIQFWAIWLLVFIICCVSCLLPILPLIGAFLFKTPFLWNQNQQIFLTISAVILIFTLLLGVLYRRNAKRIRAALENMQLQHQIEQNQLYIELLSQKYHTLRQYQHDFKKHLAYIQQLAQQNDMAAIDTYIRNVYADLQSGTALKLTGNQTLDILLSDKIQQAKMQKIAFQLEYQPGVQISHIAAPDFCILLGNLLDNALAATEQSTQKQITCTIQQKNSYYMAIHVINSCDTLPVMKDGIPQRKQPSEQHGYGVQNVLNCAKKYGGHCQFTYCSDQKQFQATVLLPCAELDENR